MPTARAQVPSIITFGITPPPHPFLSDSAPQHQHQGRGAERTGFIKTAVASVVPTSESAWSLCTIPLAAPANRAQNRTHWSYSCCDLRVPAQGIITFRGSVTKHLCYTSGGVNQSQEQKNNKREPYIPYYTTPRLKGYNPRGNTAARRRRRKSSRRSRSPRT